MWVFYKSDWCEEIQASGYRVGFYNSDGLFWTQYQFAERVDAAQQVHFLNGGNGGNCERVATKSGKDAIPETRSPMRRAT